jgi:hypothetical protein
VAYIGTQPIVGQYRKLSDISSGFDGSTTTFTTSVPPGTSAYYVTAGSASQLLISLGGVIQQPDVDYTVGINSITFTTAPAAGLDFFGVLMGDTLNIGTPSDGTITASKLSVSGGAAGQTYVINSGATGWVFGYAGATGAGTDQIFYENGQTVTTSYTLTTSKNALSAGPITINSGATVTIPSGQSWSIV